MAQAAEQFTAGAGAAPAAFDARRIAILAALGLAAYLLTLAATLPASLALGRAPGIAATGSVWNGKAQLGAATASWRVRPLRSLFRLAVSADVSMRGADTDLAGEADWRPGRLVMSDVAGTADGAMIRALAPRLPFSCDLLMRVKLERIVVSGRRSGAVGEINSTAGTCVAATGTARSALPALQVMSAMGDTGWKASAVSRAAPSLTLGEASLTPDGLLILSVEPEGAALVPDGPSLGASWEFRL